MGEIGASLEARAVNGQKMFRGPPGCNVGGEEELLFSSVPDFGTQAGAHFLGVKGILRRTKGELHRS